MGAVQGAGAPGGSPARWRFGSAVFDEASWTLTVAGRRVAVETKPLELLRELLRRDGAVATKSALLDAVWPDVSVVEGSLATAIAKLRRALGDDRGDAPIIETVPRVGYRLAVRATRDVPAGHGDGPPSEAGPVRPAPRRSPRWIGGATALGIAGAVLGALWWVQHPAAAADARVPPITRMEVLQTMRRLDLAGLDALLKRGLDPNMSLGGQHNTPLNTALETCEWNPGNEQRLVLMVRTLIDAGARLDQRNYWGDTPYSIATAHRYCGPDHPATRMIRMWCGDGNGGVRESCQARYVHNGEPAPAED